MAAIFGEGHGADERNHSDNSVIFMYILSENV